MTFVHDLSSLRLKYLLILVAVFVLPACSGGGGSDSGSSISGITPTTLNILGVSWAAPVEREDVTPLAPNEIAGYRLYYGTQTGAYQELLYIDDGSATSAQVAGLPSGTYYAVVTTIDIDGRESKYSSEVVVSL